MPKKKKRHSKADEDEFVDPGVDTHQEVVQLMEMKMRKSRAKAAFTRARNRFLDEVDEDVENSCAKEMLTNIELKMDDVIESLNELCIFYKNNNRTTEMQSTLKEIDVIEQQYMEINAVYNEHFTCSSASSKTVRSSEKPTDKKHIESDLWKQLQRVTIPIVDGNKTKYPSWKAAFSACIDQAPCTGEYKLLQLRQYLTGEALKCIENLGHSTTAYEAAKERLERKFGGKRRTVSHFLEELNSFPLIKYENPKMIERFADLLDISIINMQERSESDLESGFLYLQLVKKLPQSMIARYERWRFEYREDDTVRSLRKWVLQEAEFYSVAAETKYGLDSSYKKETKGHQNSFFGSKENSTRAHKPCKICNGAHGAWNCEVLKSMTVQERWDKANKLRLCYRCLGDNHVGKDCKRTKTCTSEGCTKVHHSLLHKDKLNPNAMSYELKEKTFNNVYHSDHTYIALRTVPVIVCANGKEIRINALLDDGSTKTYLNEDVASELGLRGERSFVKVNVLNGKSETFETSSVNFTITNDNKSINLEMEAQTTKNVTGALNPIDWERESQNWPHLKNIKFPKIVRKQKVDLLIGLDYVDLHRSLGEIEGQRGEPVARLTPLGWTCVGAIERKQSSYFSFHVNQCEQDDTLKRFWEIDSAGIANTSEEVLSIKNKALIEQVEENTRFENEHFLVPIPWKNKVSLPNNYSEAYKRLESTERKLRKNPDVLSEYKKTIEKYRQNGYITKVSPSQYLESGWYLPHFPVTRFDKATTKVRIVFDASAKYEGVSLNDMIEQGPKLQRDLFDVLLRFRKNEVAIICDIQEMYLRVGIIESDRKFHRFLWRDNQDDQPEVYEFNRVVFGVNASPFLAQFIARKNALENKNKFPMAAETVLKSTYMDDSMDSVPTEADGIKLYEQLSLLWSKAGMYARKWLSNSSKVLQHIPIKERLYETDLGDDGLPSVKTLGVLWKAEDDNFTFDYNLKETKPKMTKREYLRKIASLFDPLGLLAPYIIRAKILMQEIWLSGIEWDQTIQDDTMKKITNWLEELAMVKNIRVPRCIKVAKDVTKMTLHSFCDASERAYGAVVYCRNEYVDGDISVRLVTSKSKVAPLTAISIPRLELMSAVLSLELTKSVTEALEMDLNQCIFWTDSMDVICWLRNQSRVFKPFVANRIAEIQKSTQPCQWRHVPGKDNPADLVSRGSKIDKLVEETIWLNGPDFLMNIESEWPITKIQEKKVKKCEIRKSELERFENGNASFTVVVNDKQCIEENKDLWRLDPTRFSNFKKLKRVNAWVYRFIENCCSKSEQRKTGKLTREELYDSEKRLIQETQRKEFKEYNEIQSGKSLKRDSKLRQLNPVIDTEGILRSDSRLQFAEHMSYDSRYPIILPRSSWVTKLIITEAHEQCGHSGTNQVLSNLSSKYWIIHAREAIREVETQCRECKRRKTQPMSQIMAPLPTCRLGVPMKAFANVAVDYGGPFLTMQGRGKSRQKRYLCLFTCLATRAVHLEMAYSLDTSSFLNAFYRMVNRRGLPIKVVSDNCTYFVGADKELKLQVKTLDNEQVKKSAANKGIEWQFNPPAAPHWGGGGEHTK